MRNRVMQPVLGWVLASCLAGLAALDAAEPGGTPPLFLRVQRDDRERPVSLETAVVRYVSAAESDGRGAHVDLVGAVHIGESAYYAELNRLFTEYDAVLYELVAPAEANRPQPGQRSGHPVGLLQAAMKGLLELEYQLDRIDYSRPNLVHADLTPDEFRQSMENREESFSKLFFRLMGQGLAQQSGDPGRTSDAAVLAAIFSKDRALELKRAMALQFEDMERATLALDGPQGSTIITERNRRALAVLDSQIQAGKRRLAIFYGAAHLPDLDRKLRDERGLRPSTTKWLVAWNLQSSGERAKAERRAK
jgi:hypothetical protein